MSFPDIPMTVARALGLVQRYGSVSEAARVLGVSQPAISKGIAQLELSLGMPLLIRGTRPLKLTDEGMALSDYAVRADQFQQQVLKQLDDFRTFKSGTVRLGSFGSSASFQILPGILSAFARVFPGIRIEIMEFPDEQLAQCLEDGLVDLAIMSLPDDEELEIASVTTDRLVALVAEHHSLAVHDSVTPSDLARFPFILTKGGSGPLVERWFAALGVVPRVAHTILQVNSIIALVEADLGVSVIAEQALPKHLGGCRILGLQPEVPRSFGFVRKAIAARSFAAEKFWKFCSQKSI